MIRNRHRRWHSRVPLLIVLAVSGSMTLAGCSSSRTAVAEHVDLSAHIYVDRDGDGIWSEGDVALPEIVVLLDGQKSATTDKQGWVCFEAITPAKHTLVLDAQDVSELSSHSLVSNTTERTIDATDTLEIDFCFLAEGFMDVDVKEEQQGN